MKLDDRWKIYELMRQHNYITSYGLNGDPYPEKVKRSQNKIISNVKKILNKNITPKEFNNINAEINDYFYKDKINKKLPLLGPIGGACISSRGGAFLDLDDITEVYILSENFSGTIKSNTCGWISWMLVKGDKPILNKDLVSDYEFLVSMNHFKAESAEREVIEKYIKYKNSKDGRTFKRFFIGNRFWFHDDLDKLHQLLPYTYFFSY